MTKTGHEIGTTYLSRYWKEQYTVLSAAPDATYGESIVVKWASGRVTKHSTPRGNDTIVWGATHRYSIP